MNGWTRRRRGPGGPSPLPTVEDLASLVIARARTKHAFGRANAIFADAVLDAFRQELGTTVRSASPLLLTLLDGVGLGIDDVAWSIRPSPVWPDGPALPVSGAAPSSVGGVGSERRWRARAAAISPDACHRLDVVGGRGERLLVHVVDQSVEVAAWLDGLRLRSLFGAFRVAVGRDDPALAQSPRVGDALDDLIDCPALCGRAWSVAAVDRLSDGPDHRFSVRTGTADYVMPWTR